ncbi:MAG: preprotein translocase subunit SecG [Candidatus Hydrogenedentota bacterium]
MLATILTIIYLIVCVLLIIAILLQQDKTAGSGLGAAFGGSSQTVFGSHSGDILSKATTWLAVGFMVIALLLSFTYTKKSSITQEAGAFSPEEHPTVPVSTPEAGK